MFSVGHNGRTLTLVEYLCIFWRSLLLFGEEIQHLDSDGPASGVHWAFLFFLNLYEFLRKN